MSPDTEEILQQLARKYVWWKAPADVLRSPRRLVAQVMNIGDFDDVQQLSALVGDETLRECLRHAQAGEFNERSWHYWHYRLGMAEPGKVPPLPVRRVA
jgi:hypothetical protein